VKMSAICVWKAVSYLDVDVLWSVVEVDAAQNPYIIGTEYANLERCAIYLTSISLIDTLPGMRWERYIGGGIFGVWVLLWGHHSNSSVTFLTNYSYLIVLIDISDLILLLLLMQLLLLYLRVSECTV
jgi:hypothetical protein